MDAARTTISSRLHGGGSLWGGRQAIGVWTCARYKDKAHTLMIEARPQKAETISLSPNNAKYRRSVRACCYRQNAATSVRRIEIIEITSLAQKETCHKLLNNSAATKTFDIGKKHVVLLFCIFPENPQTGEIMRGNVMIVAGEPTAMSVPTWHQLASNQHVVAALQKYMSAKEIRLAVDQSSTVGALGRPSALLT